MLGGETIHLLYNQPIDLDRVFYDTFIFGIDTEPDRSAPYTGSAWLYALCEAPEHEDFVCTACSDETISEPAESCKNPHHVCMMNLRWKSAEDRAIMNYSQHWDRLACAAHEIRGEDPDCEQCRHLSRLMGSCDSDSDSIYSMYSGVSETGPDPRRLDLRLLRTCRQVYVEANPILYASNTFQIGDPNTLLRFVNSRNAVQKRLLRKLSLQVSFERNHGPHWNAGLNLGFVSKLKGLRDLKIHIAQGFQSLSSAGSFVFSAGCRQYRIEGILRMQILPLQNVSVTFEEVGCPRQYLNEKEIKDYTSELERTLLDPAGNEKYREVMAKAKETAAGYLLQYQETGRVEVTTVQRDISERKMLAWIQERKATLNIQDEW